MRPSIFAALLLLLASTPAAAQARPDDSPERSRFSGSIALLNTQPLGSLETGPGIGVAASGAWALDPRHIVRIRGEVRAAGYGAESRRACLTSCLIEVDINTTYATFYVGVGPELALPIAGAQLVLDATGGFGSFGVSSSVQGVSDSEDAFSTTNFEDDFFAWSTGGELRIPVSRQLSIAVGARYQHNGQASYVNEGGITVNGDGSLNISSRTTDANFMAITLGVAVRPFVGWIEDEDDDEDDGGNGNG